MSPATRYQFARAKLSDGSDARKKVEPHQAERTSRP